MRKYQCKGGETMKKAKMLLVAALVFGVILSSYGVSGTYAKYISEGGFTDQARIAKWGFTLGKTDKSTASLFKDNYNSNKIKSSSDGQDVIAPGAYGEYQFSYIDGTATPEVAFNLTATAKVTNNIGDDKVKFAIVQGDDATHAIKSSTSSIDELQKETSDFNKEEFSSYNLTASQLETLLKLLLSGDASGEKEYTANDTAVAKLKEITPFTGCGILVLNL